MNQGMKIALGVTGCIAAYKAVELTRGLQKAGYSVQVVLTRAARRFVGPLTFEALTAQPVITSMFRSGENREIGHIRLAQEVALLAVVPATANILGKFAHGIADDFLSTLYLSCPAPVLIAPAMNVEMWHHPAVQTNVRILQDRGHRIVLPESGFLACRMEGEGRLAGVESILQDAVSLLERSESLKGIRMLVSAGPTVEDIDPVRFISNRSSGKMGYALAEAAAKRAAEVLLVSGPTDLNVPSGVRRIAVRSAAEMRDAVLEVYPGMDVVIKAAAVSDYRPSKLAARKIKKGKGIGPLRLVPTDDILLILGRQKRRQILVGFAAETEDLLENARAKLKAKNLDLVVANNVARGVFGEDRASVLMVGADGRTVSVEDESKSHIAARILDWIEGLLADRDGSRGEAENAGKR